MTINKILLVDDSAADLTNLREAVSSANAQVITATNGKDAIAKARAEKPDIIFMDIVMEDMDGYRACREIVRNDETSEIPVIFVTTKNQRADKMWGEKQGGKGMIQKPYKKEEILQELQRYA